ncbi:MAG: SPFH domain-containing protein [Christensenellaceae bacterium]|nr:SPFH domain-containing protein [Christensenellaceae bacterium]
MGLFKAGIGAFASVLADQWREYFYCDALPANVLAAKGVKRVGGKSSNTKSSDNVITNGSVIAVNEGQCMMIVEQGAIVEFCAEAGEFVWDSSTEPSMLFGGFGQGIKGSWETLKKRFTFGGDTAKDQRVYFFNTKEIIGNKYGTANPVPFRVVDTNIGLDMDIGIKCFGEYSYKLSDPMLFYKNVCGNIETNYTRDQIDAQLKSELLTALQPAFAKISAMGVRYSALPGHTEELAGVLNDVLSQKWGELRGISIVSVGVNSVTANEEDEATIKELQKTAVFRNPNMAAAYMVGAQGEAMKAAASNQGGAMMGFMGMSMAQQAGGMNANQLFQMGQQQQYQQPAPAAPAAEGWKCACGATATGKFCPECGAKKPEPQAAEGWKCACGATATGKFCPECGAKKPEANGWTCSCGAVNKGKFCSECGAKKPAGVPQYKCDKCGWEPEDPKNPPKFCPECGDPFGEEDIKA